MAKYVDVDIINPKKRINIESVIGDSLKFNEKKLLKAINIFNFNTRPIILNWDKYNSFLLMGDIQSGKTNNLIYLASKLFEQNKIEVVFYLTGTKNNLLNQNQERFWNSFSKMGDIFRLYRNINIDSAIFEQNNNKKIIINSLKTILRLEQIKNLIISNAPDINYLIIDDEADEGSVSIKTKYKILEIMKNKNVKYVAITATPFKNLYKNQKFYNYFHVFKSGEGYQGIYDFKNSFKVNNDIYRTLITSFIEWAAKIVSNNYKDSQLLINVLNFNKGHDRIYNFLNKTHTKLKNKNNLQLTLKNNFKEYLKNLDEIHEFFNKFKSDDFIINNGAKNEDPRNFGWEVIIGGLKLSRGITFKNLHSEVMFNIGKNYIDPGTLIQRARWFGYGKEINNIDIYVNKVVEEAFEEAERLIEVTKDFDLNSGNFKNIFDKMKNKRLKIQ